MTIRPIDLNGMIQRADDVSMLKRHEDAKPMHDQQNIQMQVDKREDQLAHRVTTADQTEKFKNDSDAKDEGHNKYFMNKGKKKKPEEKSERVVEKKSVNRIDIKI